MVSRAQGATRGAVASRKGGSYLIPMWRILRNNYAVYAIWAFLSVELIVALATRNWTTAFIATATLGLSLLPAFFAQRFRIRLPVSFFAAAVIFIFATIYLGEQGDYYERFWWWDLLMHGGSAMGFGPRSY